MAGPLSGQTEVDGENAAGATETVMAATVHKRVGRWRPKIVLPAAPGATDFEEGPGEIAPIELAPGDAQGSELGEGAPGADGNRRWRGRRGRRRGRGGSAGPREDSSQGAFASPSDAESDTGYAIDGAAVGEAPAAAESVAPQQFRTPDGTGKETGKT